MCHYTDKKTHFSHIFEPFLSVYWSTMAQMSQMIHSGFLCHDNSECPRKGRPAEWCALLNYVLKKVNVFFFFLFFFLFFLIIWMLQLLATTYYICILCISFLFCLFVCFCQWKLNNVTIGYVNEETLFKTRFYTASLPFVDILWGPLFLRHVVYLQRNLQLC